VDTVAFVPGPGVTVELLSGGWSVLVVPGSAVEVEFEIGGSPVPVDDRSGSETVAAVDVGGGSVTVAVEETPVPGPVIPSVAVAVVVAFCDGLITLEIADEISLSKELIGSLRPVVDELVTMPVGASRIELVVVAGSTKVEDSVCAGVSELVVAGISTVLLVETGRSCSLVDVELLEELLGKVNCPCWLVEVVPTTGSLVDVGCCC